MNTQKYCLPKKVKDVFVIYELARTNKTIYYSCNNVSLEMIFMSKSILHPSRAYCHI